MGWVEHRSRRDPEFWAPLLAIALAITIVGLCAHVWAGQRIESLTRLAEQDPRTALDEALQLLRLSTWAFASALASIALLQVHYFRIGREQGRLPPAGWWSLGTHRYLVGPSVDRVARWGTAIAWLLIGLAPALGLAVEHMATVFAASAGASP